jgi:sarcosine/dimethylglycine N-methyltransferase
MNSKIPSKTTSFARENCNSQDADNFYSIIWGGDIHIGMYSDNHMTIKEVSANTISCFHELLRKRLTLETFNIADLGSGYGGVSRYLCRILNTHVSAINISDVENDRHKQLNIESGLDSKINILHVDFKNIPLASGSQDVAWCQDALLHSNNKKSFFQKVSRILKDNSYLLLVDIFRSDISWTQK